MKHLPRRPVRIKIVCRFRAFRRHTETNRCSTEGAAKGLMPPLPVFTAERIQTACILYDCGVYV